MGKGGSVRSSAKAMVMHEGKLLLIKCVDSYNGEYYSLPGGGQRRNEPMPEALRRECLEETGYRVEPERLAALCEEICLDLELRRAHPDRAHEVHHIFFCRLAGEEVVEPTGRDTFQMGIEWVPVKKLLGIKILPTLVGQNILEMVLGTAPLFLGSQRIPHSHG